MASSEHDEAPDAGTASGAPVDSSSGSERSPELFEALVADNADMIAVIDEGGRFIFVSEAARRILGLDPEAMVGQDGFALIHPEDIGLAVESMATTHSTSPAASASLCTSASSASQVPSPAHRENRFPGRRGGERA